MVIVVHLKSKAKNEDTRIGQVNHLMKYIEENHLGKYPIFILGDFNAEPTYSCIVTLLENKNICAKSLFNLKELFEFGIAFPFNKFKAFEVSSLFLKNTKQ